MIFSIWRAENYISNMKSNSQSNQLQRTCPHESQCANFECANRRAYFFVQDQESKENLTHCNHIEKFWSWRSRWESQQPYTKILLALKAVFALLSFFVASLIQKKSAIVRSLPVFSILCICSDFLQKAAKPCVMQIKLQLFMSTFEWNQFEFSPSTDFFAISRNTVWASHNKSHHIYLFSVYMVCFLMYEF